MYLAAEMAPAAFSTSIYRKKGVFKLPYPPDFLADIDRTLTTGRLSRYVRATGGDLDQALLLYEKNMALSEALFGLLHGLEVSLRNSIHYVLSRDIGQEDWYQDGLALPKAVFPVARRLSFTKPMQSMISDARYYAGPGAAIGKVVAELTFGFWPSVVSKHFEPLWDPSLYKAFPAARVPRRVIHWRLRTIQHLRNRIAHHESIMTSTNDVYTGFVDQQKITLPAILQAAEWVSPPTATWLRTSTRYEQAVTLLADFARSGITL
jgi:hypothetical protein